MLYYDRIDISKRIDPTKSNKSNECLICHYYYFFKSWIQIHRFCMQWCHDLAMLSLDISNIPIIIVKNVGYRCTIHKKMCKNAVKKLPYLLRYVPDQYKT